MMRDRLFEMRDTDAAAQRRYYELLAMQTGQRRLETAMQLTRATRRLAIAGIRERYPHLSELQERALLVERLYGAEFAHRLFGADCLDVES